MTDDPIKENPSFQNLKKEITQMKKMRLVLPFMRSFGQDTSKLEEALNKLPEFEKQLEELSTLPDRFNEIFADQGWIFYETLNMEVAKKAIKIFSEKGLEIAEETLVNYYSPEWVEGHLMYLKLLPNFSDRFLLAQKACEDYKAGRYYSSILLTLTLIDGWVNDLNIIEFQRKGFFAEDSKLIAWDSVTAHTRGLVRLQELFSKRRMQTRTEKITIPYRNGIFHGMDLGFDNPIVAAKCWAALFAVRDWVIKVRKGELAEPQVEKKEEKSLKDTIEDYKETIRDTERLKNWKPRSIVLGKDIPLSGNPENYSNNTPERILVEFLACWITNNYGFMANYYAPMANMKPFGIREIYSKYQLKSYEITKITDKLPCSTNIEILAEIEINDCVEKKKIDFIILCNNEDGKLANIPNNKTIWGIGGMTIEK